MTTLLIFYPIFDAKDEYQIVINRFEKSADKLF